MKIVGLCILLTFTGQAYAQTPQTEANNLGPGEQPQISMDGGGTVRLVYGLKDKIFYILSGNGGKTFSKPVMIAEVHDMHLGMTRGPQLATSKNYSIVTAIDRKGTIHAYRLDHKTDLWTGTAPVNDVASSAMEGLMSIAADNRDNFYAVWLDLREDRHNKIAFSSLSKNGGWSTNTIIYKSPEMSVCECCKPSVAVRDNVLAIMFRNSIGGSRDLYLITSRDNGAHFAPAEKLGRGTWKLRGCPMDGGGLSVDKEGNIHTVWQREGRVYYSIPGAEEIKISEGRNCSVAGGENVVITWQQDGQLKAKAANSMPITLGEGKALQTVQAAGNTMLAVWEKDDQLFFRKSSF